MNKPLAPLLITVPFTYANGKLHLGHLLSYIQADIHKRVFKMLGRESYLISGSDMHGTPIMLAAAHKDPRKLAKRYAEGHLADLRTFNIDIDMYSSTDTEENRRCVEKFYTVARRKGLISRKMVKGYYDLDKNMFLPDRYVIGTCSQCGAVDQYVDHCEQCAASDSLVPDTIRSKISDTQPIIKHSEHLFLDLPLFQKELLTWLKSASCKEVYNFLHGWHKEGLKQWDISRESPYLGFAIPGEDAKFFYVWFDAPINYVTAAQKLSPDLWDKAEIHQYLGKDIMYFHGIFWPGLLLVGDHKLPDQLHVHGHVSFNDSQKMSKSKGLFISAEQYINNDLHPDYLRYFYAKRAMGLKDFSLQDFQQTINFELLGKIANIASRSTSLLQKCCRNRAHFTEDIEGIELEKIHANILRFYQAYDYRQVILSVLEVAEYANKIFTENAPWNSDNPQRVCSAVLLLYAYIMLWLRPIMPSIASRSLMNLNIDPSIPWENILSVRLNDIDTSSYVNFLHKIYDNQLYK